MKRVPVLWWCVISFAVAVIIALALPAKYRYLAHPKAAEDLAKQLRAGKWERVADYISDEELRDASMNRPQVERLFAEYIKPAVAKENADLSIRVQTTEYNSTVTVGKGLTKFEILLTNYPALLKPSYQWGIHLSLVQVAVMRSVRAHPELQGKARRTETAKQLLLVANEAKAYGLKALPARPASLTSRDLRLFP